ncbi:hypothetical protein TcG_10383 [Trypanosoma cruzi]|nr:hypothetical protein TcG_10383 [Trypanosoma cruzi]
MSNKTVVCALTHHNTLSSVGSGLCHTTRHGCNITYTQQNEIRKNIVIQDATTTSPVSSCCGNIPQNMVHAHRELVVQLHKQLMGQATWAQERRHQSILGLGAASESH